jgi:hypothetical protein
MRAQVRNIESQIKHREQMGDDTASRQQKTISDMAKKEFSMTSDEADLAAAKVRDYMRDPRFTNNPANKELTGVARYKAAYDQYKAMGGPDNPFSGARLQRPGQAGKTSRAPLTYGPGTTPEPGAWYQDRDMTSPAKGLVFTIKDGVMTDDKGNRVSKDANGRIWLTSPDGKRSLYTPPG